MTALAEFDWIIVSTSGGKDSQATADVICEMAKAAGVLDRVVFVHADLGRAEWGGTRELAQEHAEHYGCRFEVTKREGLDLLDQVRQRGMWPDAKNRWCTSDFKRGPIRRVFTKLVNEKWDGTRTIKVLNCMGMRAEESPKRAKMPVFEFDASASSRTERKRGIPKRLVWNLLPIHGWTAEQVWERIRQAGTRHHEAYDLGMPRLSCRLCILASEGALKLAAQVMHEQGDPLLEQYLEVEAEIGHTFQNGRSLASIVEVALSEPRIRRAANWAA